MIRVAFYTRISTDEDTQKYSLAAQKERLEAFCASQFGSDWRQHQVYRDTASGTHLNRPALQEMLADAEAQAFDILLVFRVDRLSRRVRELAFLVDELTKHGVALRSITEPFDTSNPAGKMMLQMLGVFAEFEHSTIIERTKTGMLKKAKTGSWPGGTVPIGYSYDKENGLQVDEREAAAVRKIFDLYTEGREGSGSISDKLNAAGHRRRSGRRFDRKAVLHILKNPFYTGKFRWQKEVYEGEHEPIIDQETFDKAAQLLQQRAAESPGVWLHNKDEHLLSGVMRCGKCRSGMVGVSCRRKEGKIRYYACRKRLETKDCDQDYVRAEELEGRILAEVQAIFRNEALLESIWREAQKKLAEEAPDIDEELRQLRATQADVRARLDRYFAAFETGSMDPADCSERVQDLRTRLQQLDDAQEALQAQRRSLDLPALKTDFLEQILTNLAGLVAAVPGPQKKHLLHLLVKKVLIRDRRTAEVRYRLPDESAVRIQSDLVPPTGLEPVLPP